MPSDTGQLGGKVTGDKVSHYIVDGHGFDVACRALMTKNFTLSWYDRFPAIKPENINPVLKSGLKFSGESVNR